MEYQVKAYFGKVFSVKCLIKLGIIRKTIYHLFGILLFYEHILSDIATLLKLLHSVKA